MSVYKSFAVLLGCGMMLGAAQLPAAPTASMLADTCAGCHGTDGASAGPAIPSLAHMSTTYMVDSMKAFKSGERGSTIMGRIAKGYTDEEIELMAKVFAEQSIATTSQKTDPAKVAAGEKLYGSNCEKCHDEKGGLADDDAGILYSQWIPYMQYSMQDFKGGAREMPKKMKKKVEKLSDDEIESLLQFFASQQ